MPVIHVEVRALILFGEDANEAPIGFASCAHLRGDLRYSTSR
jgi:hypothetical protein